VLELLEDFLHVRLLLQFYDKIAPQPHTGITIKGSARKLKSAGTKGPEGPV
jgi:hypothetical protein